MTERERQLEAEKRSLSQTELSCLLATLNEAQQTIRAYDTKAQIVGVGFIFSVTMISRILENLPVERLFDVAYVIGGFVLLIGPVALFGSVLYPTRRTAPKTQSDASQIRKNFYFSSANGRDLTSYLRDIDNVDWRAELAYEITRLSGLRDLKRRRFLSALFAAGGSFTLILIANVLKLAGIT